MERRARTRIRSALIILMAIAVLVVGGTTAAAQTPKRKTLEVRLGWQMFAGGSSAIVATMIQDKLFEKHAAQFGYEVAANWRAFIAGPPVNEAMAAGQLDLDLIAGALPFTSRLAAGIPAIPIAVIGSHMSNAVLVAPNSTIKDVSQLQGKTIGLVIGSSSHLLLASIAYAHFGKSIEELNIKLINMPVSEAVKLTGGIDAAVVWVPQRFIGPHLGISKMLIDGDGYTGEAHRTPGVRLPEVKKSWGYPEGYTTDRIFASAHPKFLNEHPDLVVALLLAYKEAQAGVVKDRSGAIEAINTHWKQSKVVVETTLDTYAETAGIRNTPAILEWDVHTLIKISEFLTFMKVRDRAMTWEELKPIFMKGAEVQRRAWEIQKPQVALGEMYKGFSGATKLYGPIIVNGGAPVWEWEKIADWGKRIYTPGPFPTRR